MYQNDAKRVRTGEVRLSYLHLSEPWAAKPDQTPKYSCTLLIPKSDSATYNDIKSAIEAAASAAVAKTWQGVRPRELASVIHDGDGLRENGTAYGDECKGCWVLTASTKIKPTTVHISNVRAELDPRDIYSGMYGYVTLNFYGYSSNGKKGVAAGLNNVCKTRDGDPLNGKTSAENDFGDLESTGAVNPITGEPIDGQLPY